eukprot:1557980-Karenia_brevis.AAC.1
MAIIAPRKRLVDLHGKHLVKNGLQAKMPRSTRDLGLDTTQGEIGSAIATIMIRITGARARAHRVGQFK